MQSWPVIKVFTTNGVSSWLFSRHVQDIRDLELVSSHDLEEAAEISRLRQLISLL